MDRAQTKKVANIAREYKELYTTLDSAKNTVSSKQVNRHIKNVSNRGKSNLGNRITSIGVALIAFPDPTVSDLVGSALVLAGQYIQRRSQIGVEDVYREFNKIGSKLKETLTI